MPPVSSPVPLSVKIYLEDIGPVLLERSAKAKHVSIRIKPLAGVRVAVPNRVSFEQAQVFLRSKIEWIKHHLQKIQVQENKVTLFTRAQPFSTFRHRLHLNPTIGLIKAKAQIAKGYILVSYPAHLSETEPHLQQFIRQVVEATYRLEAKAYLPGRVAYFADKFNFTYQKVVIKNASTCWGSCSATNNINLSLHLMRLPEALRDYVILHELAHTVEKNHGPRFWALLEKISGNARGLDTQLKVYRISIF